MISGFIKKNKLKYKDKIKDKIIMEAYPEFYCYEDFKTNFESQVKSLEVKNDRIKGLSTTLTIISFLLSILMYFISS